MEQPGDQEAEQGPEDPPGTRITVFFRSDGSGDTYAFTRYLSDIYGTFAGKVGASTPVTFPTGVGAKGNPGMSQAVQQTNGGIGYIAATYLVANAAGRGDQERGRELRVPNLSTSRRRRRGQAPPNNELTIVNPR